MVLALAIPAQAARLKDVASVRGVRENVLIGYGIVVGLKGTGDSSADITGQSLQRFLGKLGLELPEGGGVKSKNAAAVIVTAKLPPFARAGSKIDVTVSSIGDAPSLEGGQLLATPLRAGDQNVYAFAQGFVSLGTLADGGGKVFPTIGRVASGGTVERDVESEFSNKRSLRLALSNPDFTTAARVAAVVNGELGGKFAIARDAATIDVVVPFQYESNVVELMSLIESFQVHEDTKAKVVLNERTGTVVMGEHISILPVAIAHGELTIEVAGKEDPNNRQLAQDAGAAGDKKKGPQHHIGEIQKTTKISDLVRALNTLGVQPKDLTAIFQTLKRLGALQAELEFM